VFLDNLTDVALGKPLHTTDPISRLNLEYVVMQMTDSH